MPVALALLAKRALSTIVDTLGKLNLWQLLLIASLLLAGVQTLRLHAEQRHSGKLQAQLTKINAALQAERDAVNAKNAELAGISAQLRKANDEESRAIHGDAGTLRLSGPGRAVCRPVAPAAPGGRVAPVAKPDAAGPALPPDDSAAVPWSWLVDRAEEHDELLAEVKAWRQWHDQVLQAWPKNTGAAPR